MTLLEVQNMSNDEACRVFLEFLTEENKNFIKLAGSLSKNPKNKFKYLDIPELFKLESFIEMISNFIVFAKISDSDVYKNIQSSFSHNLYKKNEFDVKPNIYLNTDNSIIEGKLIVIESMYPRILEILEEQKLLVTEYKEFINIYVKFLSKILRFTKLFPDDFHQGLYIFCKYHRNALYGILSRSKNAGGPFNFYYTDKSFENKIIQIFNQPQVIWADTDELIIDPDSERGKYDFSFLDEMFEYEVFDVVQLNIRRKHYLRKTKKEDGIVKIHSRGLGSNELVEKFLKI